MRSLNYPWRRCTATCTLHLALPPPTLPYTQRLRRCNMFCSISSFHFDSGKRQWCMPQGDRVQVRSSKQHYNTHKHIYTHTYTSKYSWRILISPVARDTERANCWFDWNRWTDLRSAIMPPNSASVEVQRCGCLCVCVGLCACGIGVARRTFPKDLQKVFAWK